MAGAALTRVGSFTRECATASPRDLTGRGNRSPRSLSMSSSNALVSDDCRLRGFSALQIQGGIMRNRAVVSMCMGMSGDDSFFKSSVVQNEIGRLQADYKNLLKIGRKYGQFDREGKKFYIEEMRTLIERWQIFYKRMELSDDFTAKLCAKQLKTTGGPLGLSNVELVTTLYVALDDMHRDADEGL
ncbi:hypothetical protein Mapa_000428 [Marchantia paleacea]|nr:hypothetical protein Mapa_000428 [Marchantia paleacea]